MPDPDHPEIYSSQARQYEALVSREDYQGHLLRAIQQVLPLEGLNVVELGLMGMSVWLGLVKAKQEADRVEQAISISTRKCSTHIHPHRASNLRQHCATSVHEIDLTESIAKN